MAGQTRVGGQEGVEMVNPCCIICGDDGLHPRLCVQCIEGMKAYRGVDGVVRLFRPMENIKRLNMSAAAVCLPVRGI